MKKEYDVRLDELGPDFEEYFLNCLSLLDKEVSDDVARIVTRLKGKILNIFESIITDEKQLSAVKNLVQDMLAQVVLSDLKFSLKAKLLSFSQKFNCVVEHFNSVSAGSNNSGA